MKQKIMFFITGMTTGGAERVVANLSNGLDARDFDVVIAMVKGDESAYELAPRVRLYSANLLPGLRNFLRALQFYRRLVKQESPEVIASFSMKSDFIALLSKIVFRTPGRLTVSDRADPYTRDRWMQFACNTLYRWSDSIVCQSQSVANYYRTKYRRANISVIANPLNEECIGEPTVGLKAPIVISVGRLTDQKNHRLAIRAFKEIRESFPGLTLKIFGYGPLEEELKRLIRTEQLEGCVTLEGVLPDVIRQHESAALFLFTSNYEGYPNALIEAAATGIPIVTTDFSPGTASEIIVAGVNGYIVPAHDQEALVSAAIEVLSGALDADEVIAASHRVREKHQAGRILEAWLHVFRSP